MSDDDYSSGFFAGVVLALVVVAVMWVTFTEGRSVGKREALRATQSAPRNQRLQNNPAGD